VIDEPVIDEPGSDEPDRLPRVLGNAAVIVSQASAASSGGALWKLQTSPRHLDANIIHLPPNDRIDMHTGPDLDVLLLVIDGTGELVTNAERTALISGSLAWLPRRSRRAIIAGAAGLSYFSVHQRRPPLGIGSPPNAANRAHDL
jgi:quercetin dioxygenase-like cupin family protein